MSGTAFIAFARVYSGTLRPGKEVYVLGPKHDPAKVAERVASGQEVCDASINVHSAKANSSQIMKTEVGKLYLLIGRELEELQEVPAGNVVGIGGLQDFVLKSATLSSDYFCPAFVELSSSAVPILRVAVEPARSSDMSRLAHGLHLLNQADANVEVLLTDKGEHILVTAGEVHLERCLRDLINDYAGVEVNASSPIVPFRETVVLPPETDMVNEQLNDDNRLVASSDEEKLKSGAVVELQTADKRCTLKLRALPLPAAATKLLEESVDLFRALEKETSDSMASATAEGSADIRRKLTSALKDDPFLSEMVDLIWSFGPKKCGPNILINNVPGLCDVRSVWPSCSAPRKRRAGEGQNEKAPQQFEYESSVVNGFQLATAAGPLCDEPLMGVAFILDECSLTSGNSEEDSGVGGGTFGPLSGQIVSAMKEGCKRAFQANPQRLMAAMYTCNIQVYFL